MSDYVAIQAAPRANVSGLLSGSHSGIQARVIILPKPWAPAGRGSRATVEVSLPPDTVDFDLTLYEGEVCVVRGTAAQCRVLRSLVEHSFGASEGRDEDGAPTSLLAFGAAVSGAMGKPEIATSDWRPTALLSLAERFDLIRIAGEVAVALSYAPRLRVLLYRAFVEEVERQIRRVPKRYEEQTESVRAVRGRILTRAMVKSTATRTPQLECRFDELMTGSRAVRVVATALERVIASGSGAIDSPIATAVALRRYLSDIAALPQDEALRLARYVTVNRLDRGWATALDLAVAIMRGTDPVIGRGTTSVSTFELKIPTWRLWEQILTTLLTPLAAARDARVFRAGDRVPLPGFQVARPFCPPSRGFSPLVDFTWVGAGGQRLILLDAKYKLAESPSSADQYQAFAYTHLHRLGDVQVERYVLLHSGPSGSAVRTGSERMREWIDAGDPPTAQQFIRIPFPAPDQCAGLSWETYRRDIADQMQNVLTLD